MNNNCTIIMYHYVRDLQRSRYPEIKGLDLNLFVEQIEYLMRHYSIITMEQFIAANNGEDTLPKNAVLLTFDDAYIDHYTNVFPVLDKRKVQGSFFTPVKAVTENKILDVNKLHFILASVDDKKLLISEIFSSLNEYRESYNLDKNDNYYKRLAIADRYDSAEVIFIKRLLQVDLVETLRSIITDKLFRKFVSTDEVAFCRELYMSKDQIECLKRNGMHIGGHGNNHYWLASLNRDLQYIELTKSLEFLKSIGVDENNWTMCYPYGSYNDDTIDLLNTLNCKLAFTTEVDIANSVKYHKFKQPRLDTNDIPKDRYAATNDWFKKQF